jgi:hypothetical protein
MLALRFAGLLALAVWFGGLVTLGAIAAPAIFDVVSLRQVADGRVLSGAIFGEILRRFHLVAYGCATFVIGGLIARAVLGPRPRRFALRVGIAAAMLAATLYSGLVLSPRIEQLRAETGGSPSSLDANDPRRIAFGQLHGRSTTIHLVAMIGGLMLLILEARE